MRILIITQRVDAFDSNLGFFHRWLEEFAKNCEQVTVIAQFVGEHRLPANVRVLSLGKERKISKLCQLLNFYRILWRESSRVDAIFVHMIPLWVVLGAPIYKIYRKPVYLWYVHRSVTLLLRFAEKIVVKIFTASRESFRLPSKKVEIVGHGIDTEYFVPRPESRAAGVYRILTAGRITESKRIREMIVAIAELRKYFPADKKLEFAIVGDTRTPPDEKYLTELKRLVAEFELESVVKFYGGVSYAKIVVEYQKSNLFLNFSLTGSVDKAVLEAMSCGADVLVANEAFFDILPPENVIKFLDAQAAAMNIKNLISGVIGGSLRELVVRDNNIINLIVRMLKLMQR